MGVLATGSPDGTITLRTWTTDGTPAGEKAKWEFLSMRTLNVRSKQGHGGGVPKVTSLKFIGCVTIFVYALATFTNLPRRESLCHGEDTGKAFLWTLPD